MFSNKRTIKFVKPLYSKKDCMHNFGHIKRIKRKVAFLKKQYKILDKDFLNFLIYFHGIRKWAEKNKRKLVKLGYPSLWVSKINKPITPEGKVVWDANMLENVGKFGIKKTLALERYYGQTRKQTLKIAEKFMKNYKFYTPLGKKLGNPGIKIKRKWAEKELGKLKKK